MCVFSLQTNKPPGRFKHKKTVYFIKNAPTKLEPENISRVVIQGEIGENPLESLAAVAQDVFMPLLTSPAHQQGWPDVVAKEVNENMHKFVSNGARGHARMGRGAWGDIVAQGVHACTTGATNVASAVQWLPCHSHNSQFEKRELRSGVGTQLPRHYKRMQTE